MENLVVRKKILIMLAAMSAMLFAALNQTIVGTALPHIISELKGMNYYSWIFSIYMLCSSVTAILVGKLSDIYGRKLFILIGIGVFTTGSFLCGLSNSMIMLIIFRGIQGMGAGMIMPTSFAIVGDLFSPRERGKWQGLMTSIFGVSSMIGPTMGGWIVDNADWHWIFWVFLPVGIIAFLMIWIIYPKYERNVTKIIDYYGSLFITLTLIPFLLAITWGGKEYSWFSPQIILLFSCAVLFFSLFIFAEKKSPNPVLPLSMFKNAIISKTSIIGFILGLGMFASVMYMPFFVQGVLGTSATISGLVVMPQTVSMVIGSAICGYLITKTGKYKIFLILGTLTMAIGVALLAMMGADSSIRSAVINMIVVGTGLGFCFPVITISAQNAVSHDLLGVVTSSAQLFRQLGGTIGVALLGMVINGSMQSKLAKFEIDSRIDDHINLSSLVSDFDDVQILIQDEKLNAMRNALPIEIQDLFISQIQFIREILSSSITFAFFLTSIILFAGFILSLTVKEIPLRSVNRPSRISQKASNSKEAHVSTRESH